MLGITLFVALSIVAVPTEPYHTAARSLPIQQVQDFEYDYVESDDTPSAEDYWEMLGSSTTEGKAAAQRLSQPEATTGIGTTGATTATQPTAKSHKSFHGIGK
ncbi:uncharacterized protein LOC131435993 [Malaya genurostris]|uniref:uncharacterized protein LOC131435993 n=1 Tax=Malaya genurostris TaxID=325434 RepID=UPI0026F3FFB1|nr:uncharacterized protein LOC131435993 [Malaya genurostris]